MHCMYFVLWRNMMLCGTNGWDDKSYIIYDPLCMYDTEATGI
jgi:hypothetical protein